MTAPEPGARGERGVYQKFRVERTDGSSAPGAKHDGCEYFVLDLTHDPFAEPALAAYARACTAKYPALARDLWAKLAAVPPSAPAVEVRRIWSDDQGETPGRWLYYTDLTPPLLGYATPAEALKAHAAAVARPAGGDTVLPAPQEQQAAYGRRKLRYDEAMQAWRDGGKVGPPPPHPVPPHTPGWGASEVVP